MFNIMSRHDRKVNIASYAHNFHECARFKFSTLFFLLDKRNNQMVQNLLLVLEVADVFLPQHPSLLLAFYHVTMFDALIVLCSEKKTNIDSKLMNVIYLEKLLNS